MSRSREDPQNAVELFLEERRPEVSEHTQYNNKGHLTRFVSFLSEEGIESTTELDAFALRRFKTWLRNNHSVNEVTVGNYVSTVRAFLRWAEKVDLTEEGLYEKMDYPRLTKEQQTRDVSIDPDEAEAVLSYCRKFEYGTIRHVAFHLMWHTAFRLGTIRALDLSDWHSDERFLETHHRPETGTPLKNKRAAERQINISEELADVIDDYVQYKREPVKDEYGRKPLLTTTNGRAYDSLLRKHIYALTRPCKHSGHCPHGREQSSCEATNYNKSSKCPSSVSPHPVRRASITRHLNNDWPQELVSEKANVSPDVLDTHYDVRTQEEKRKNRRKYLEEL